VNLQPGPAKSARDGEENTHVIAQNQHIAFGVVVYEGCGARHC
jgi:hypothetical protein